jgi:hypothetical protein
VIEVHVHGSLMLCKGVSRAQVEEALRPWLDYIDADSIGEVRSLHPDEPGIEFDGEGRTLELCWSGEVGRDFQPRLQAALDALGPFVDQAIDVEVDWFDDAGEEETQVVFVGPNPEAIHEAQRRRMVEDVSDLLGRHFDEPSVAEVVGVVNRLFDREARKPRGASGGSRPADEHITPPGRRHLH